MLKSTQKRLTIRFAAVLVTFAILILTTVFIYFHQNMVNSLKRHMREDIQTELIDQFHRTGLDTFKSQWEDYHFQILKANGEIVVASPTELAFYPTLNRKFLASTFSGDQNFEMKRIRNEFYLVSYFPLDEKHAGRIAASFTPELQRLLNFLKLLLLTLPWMLLLSYLVSRYLVSQAMKPITEAFTFQEHFSSSVSHELRTPLASLKGNFEVSLRKERTSGEYRETMRLGLAEVDRITHLLDDLYLIASSRFKPLDLHKEEVDIKTLISEAVDAVIPNIRARGIRIDNSVNESLIWVCDEALMRRVFQNLLTNAVKYTPNGGSIALYAFDTHAKRMVSIVNTCKGIDGQEIKYLFEPFYRGKTIQNRRVEGKGLGLFIVRYIVRSHGGEIAARVEGNKFSITVSLPAK